MPLFPCTVGTRRNDLYSGVANKQTLITNFATSLTSAGWTVTAQPAYNILQFSGQPSNNDTLTLVGTVYTFKTTASASTDIQIGATLSDTLDNLVTTVNGIDTNVTAVRFTATATIPCTGTCVKITSIDTTYAAPAAYTIAHSSSVISNYFDISGTGYFVGWGFKCVSATTPQGLRLQVYMYVNPLELTFPVAPVRFIVSNINDTQASGVLVTTVSPSAVAFGQFLDFNLGGDWRIICNAYQFFVLLNNVAGNTQYSILACGVPYVPSFQQALSVTDATNASPIVITTSTSHGYTTGDSVCLREVQGNTAANTAGTITVISTTRFSIDGSVGNGTYTSGGIVGKIPSGTTGQIAECIWLIYADGFSASMFRSYLTANAVDYWVLLNNSVNLSTGTSGAGTFRFVVPAPASTDYASNDLRFYNNQEFGSAAWLQVGTTQTSTGYVVGALWDAALVMQSQNRDDSGSMLGYTMWNLTDQNTGSTANARGSCYVIVP